jgi:hypothetical protein
MLANISSIFTIEPSIIIGTIFVSGFHSTPQSVDISSCLVHDGVYRTYIYISNKVTIWFSVSDNYFSTDNIKIEFFKKMIFLVGCLRLLFLEDWRKGLFTISRFSFFCGCGWVLKKIFFSFFVVCFHVCLRFRNTMLSNVMALLSNIYSLYLML